MRLSSLIGRTLREAPREARVAGHALLARAGYLRTLAGGATVALPLGARLLDRIERRLRAALDACGAQSIEAPPDPRLAVALGAAAIASPAELPFLAARRGAPAAPPSAPAASVARSLPEIEVLAYAPAGDSAARGLDPLVPLLERMAAAAGSDRLVWAGPGSTAGRRLVLPGCDGPDAILRCDACGRFEDPRFGRPAIEDAPPEPALPVEEVATPNSPTIDAVARLLDIPRSRTAKAVFFSIPSALVFAVVRGDLEIGEEKLARVVEADRLQPARDEEILAAGAIPGYASPIGMGGKAIVVADPSVARASNLVTGANRAGFHLRNTNHGRDWTADLVADIAGLSPGSPCPCGGSFAHDRALAIGIAESFDADEIGRLADAAGIRIPIPFRVARAAVSLGALAVAAAQAHCDARGLLWPPALAPFSVHIVLLDGGDGDVSADAKALHDALRDAGIDALLDDRGASPGVKLCDADLIGAPIRIVVGRKAHAAGEIEMKRRASGQALRIPRDGALRSIHEALCAEGER